MYYCSFPLYKSSHTYSNPITSIPKLLIHSSFYPPPLNHCKTLLIQIIPIDKGILSCFGYSLHSAFLSYPYCSSHLRNISYLHIYLLCPNICLPPHLSFIIFIFLILYLILSFIINQFIIFYIFNNNIYTLIQILIY